MTIDDQIPVQDNSTPINSRPSVSGEWWLPLLEKAYAKVSGNYANLNSGLQAESMRLLTGMPVKTLKINSFSESDLWELLA